MTLCRFVATAIFALLGPLPVFEAAADQAAARDRPAHIKFSANWPMEVLQRADGKKFAGLLIDRDKDEVQFVEVRRPSGKPWYLVIHYYHPDAVKDLTSIGESDRQRLYERIGPLLKQKSHAGVEAGRMEDVNLRAVRRGDEERWHYDGELFELISSADSETTRRCIVRIEQLFRAFQHVLPPRARRGEKLRVRLEGSMDAYYDELVCRKLNVANPAVFYAQRNEILAGCELTRFGQRLEQLRKASDDRRRQYETLNEDFPARLNQLAAQLRQAGFSAAEIDAELRARSVAWKRELAKKISQLAAVDRRNADKFSDVTQQMFVRLNHEAFHAYLENYVFPHRQFAVPRWLNEGLAQVFENGQLDGDTLRLDRPDPVLLKQLQTDLSGRKPLPLAQLLASQEGAFLALHDDSMSSSQHYLYAWGLAHFLVFEAGVLSDNRLQDYVDPAAGELNPINRFERLAGEPLADFQRRWRQAMLQLRPTVR